MEPDLHTITKISWGCVLFLAVIDRQHLKPSAQWGWGNKSRKRRKVW